MNQPQMPDFIQQCAAWPTFGAGSDYSIFNVPPPATTPFSNNAASFNADSSPTSPPTFPNGCANPAVPSNGCTPYGYGAMPNFDYSWYYMQQPESYGAIAPVEMDTKNFAVFNQWKTSAALLDATRSPMFDTQRNGGPIFAHKTGPGTNNVRVRTADKYRTVYSDQIRLQLEAEFLNNEFITPERKAELAGELQLTERQIKIWFQNRRAKSRKEKSRLRSNTMNLNLTA